MRVGKPQVVRFCLDRMSASSLTSPERAASFVAASAVTGSTLGLAEAAWISLSQRPNSLAAALEILWFASIGYSIGSVAAALVVVLLVRKLTWARLDVGTAIGCAAAACAAFVALSLARGMGSKQYLLLAVGAATLAVGLLRLTRWVVERAPFEISLTRLLAVHLVALAIALLIAFFRYGHALQRAVATSAALIAVALATFLLVRNRSIRLAVLGNAAAVAALLTLPFAPRGSDASASNVLLITVDTLRADRLGVYGHETAHTPNLDRLAEQSFVFENALASSPRTGPSHTSILTGLYPHRHGALSNGTHPAAGLDSLPTRLGARGFVTGAVVSGWTLRADVSGLDRYFHTYDNDFSQVVWLPEPVTELRLFRFLENVRGRLPRVERPARATTDAAVRWLRRHDASAFFLWVHYFDPHLPYDPPAEFERLHARHPIAGFRRDWYQYSPDEREELRRSRADREYMKALYDGEISYVDAEIGRLLDALEESGLTGRTLTVLTADHGETLDEHEHFFGHDDLYQTSLRVPLLIRPPASELQPRRVEDAVRTVDLAPTLLDLLGISGLPGPDGRSFGPMLVSGRAGSRQPSLASLTDREHKLYSVTRAPFKLISKAPHWFGARRQGASEELYDLEADPAELDNLAADRPELVRELRPLIDVQRAHSSPDSLSDEDRDRLRSLGYLN